MKNNEYPPSFIKKHIYKPTNSPTNNSEESNIYCALPCNYGIERITRKLKNYNIKTRYKTTANLKEIPRHPNTKHNSNHEFKSNIVYCIPCKSCPATYIGETGKTLEERVNQHKTAFKNHSPLSLLVDHALKQDHIPNFENTDIIYNNIQDKHSRLFLGEFLVTAPRNGNTYYIEEFNNSVRITKVREDIWHRRLGHLNKEAVAKMNIGEKRSDNQCTVCMESKMKKLPFSISSNKDKRASYPLELIHSDVVGPINPRSKGISNYFVTFIDDFSHYTMVYFMKNKNEVLEKFKEYKNFVENFHEKRIKTLRSDNGKEYCNSEFDWLLIKNGIRRQLSVPRTPQQNGVSERMNQTLLNTARCLLTESGIPITFWGDAIHTACYLRNKSPSKAIDNKIPEELWSGRESKIGYLKVFGCKSWCSIDDCHRKSKFSPKAKECVLIGYPEGTKGYKVWDFRNDKIYVTRNVRFSEDIFPCKKPNDPTKSFELDQFSTTSEEEDFYEEQLIHQREEDLQTKKGEEIKRDIVKNPQPSTEEPSTIEEALCGPEATNWSEAIQRELQGLEEKGIWEIVPRPVNKRVIDSRWVFKQKFNSYGNLREYRAIIVAHIWILTDSRSAIQHLSHTGELRDKVSRNIIGYLQKLSKTSKIHLQWIPSHVGIEGNEAADVLAKKGTKEPLPQKNKLTFKEIETVAKTKINKNWRIPPKHSWYSGVNPGGALNIRNRQHQTTLTRFRTGHLKPLKIENNNKIYPICPKCSLSPAAPEHILACIRCTKQDLWERPLLIIKQLEEHELMEFVPVIKHKSIRFLLALAVEREWNIFQMDVKSAYLNAPLHETVYMELPESSLNHQNSSNEVFLLKKSIYGLKQSGHEWNEKLDQILTSIGLESSIMDTCVYFSKDIILGVYVDDLLVTTSSVESYVKFKSSIQGEVDIKDLGEVSDLLSVRIKRNKDSNFELDQTHYIEEILKEYGMEHVKEASTPLDPGMFTEGPGGKEACSAPYQQDIGNLLWLTGMTRPDIAYAVSYLSKFNSSPLQQHWNAVKHLLRYLKKTKDLKLVFSKTGKKLAAFADADWGSDKEDRKSYSGYIFVLGGAAISWCSRKQKCVALSTAEAEYYAMCVAAKEALWFTSFMEEIGVDGFKESPLKIYIENQGAMFLAENKVVSERKHIDIRHFFIRDLIKDGKLSFVYVPTKENPADLFTKNLKAPALQQNYTKLGLCM
ncbi:hypothetical protein LAZ67_16002180 [Cordylochernes scorpioides]|uniref:Integrase catalytic domain-containing protein n=1 Tax=Cordylochernes scorpioides TaxID=51811 RepID=A0ABY6LEH0_9ARAC|nr:hypothetical protein LAZ67_16002180 [Cordylochernes scorpioides]